MGNWLKGRVLISDVSLIAEGTQQGNQQVVNQTTSYQSTSVQSMSAHSLPIELLIRLDEEEQIKMAKRIGLIQHLPILIYDGGGSSSSIKECVICMVEFSKGDSIRFLPCLHTYHVHCIDDWLMRSFNCPSCMEPVDVALLNTF